MKLQQIINEYSPQHWLRVCTLNGVDKFDLLEYIGEPIYVSKYLIGEFTTTERCCRKCKSPFDLGFCKGSYFIKVTCKCRGSSTGAVIDKFTPIVNEDVASRIINHINQNKTRKLQNKIQCWTDQGYTIVEAKEKVKEVQTIRSSRSPSSQPGARGYSQRTKEYWINRFGYTESDAIAKVKEVQVTNGLPYYIEKHGKEAGLKKFNSRIEAWLSSSGMKEMTAGRSKKSIELFELLPGNNFGKQEKTVRGKSKVYRVDYIYKNIIIEFNGDYWHANPSLYAPDTMVRKKVAQDIWIRDAAKKMDLEENGYKVLVIWESEYKSNREIIISKCKEFINENL